MFGRQKHWQRVATRYDRRPSVFFSAIALAATALFWLLNNKPRPQDRTNYVFTLLYCVQNYYSPARYKAI